jgi:hypothetical protein
MRFQPGHSGNPAGRPPGSRNKKTLAFEAAFEAQAEEAVHSIMERAKGGERVAMRLAMERAVPAGRHRRIAFGLPAVRTPEDAEAAIEAVMDGLAEGALTLAEVADLLRIVERLLTLANTIRMTKARWAIFFDTPAVQPGADDDGEGAQESVADVAAGAEAPADGEAEDDGATDRPLYFPVNFDGEEPAERTVAGSELAAKATRQGPPGHAAAPLERAAAA